MTVSLQPTMLEHSLASRARSVGERSMPVSIGKLWTRVGIWTDSAMVTKCLKRASSPTFQ
jgi:hypothetical protein